MKKIKTLITAMLLSVGGMAFAQSTAMGATELARMKGPGPKVAPMLAVCGANSSVMDALRALEKRGGKATVFVSSAALADEALVRMLVRRSDLFEIGNLGESCHERSLVLGNIKQAYIKRTAESDVEIKAMKALAENVLRGSRFIEKTLGSKPRFFAFGKDFANPTLDPFEQRRLLVGVADYLDKPTAELRYNAFAKSKAIFSSWVVLTKLDRGGPRVAVPGQNNPGGMSTLTQKSFEEKLSKMPKEIVLTKASEVWMPSVRGPLAREVESEMRQQAEINAR